MSRNNEATDPAFALALNPLNSEARVNEVVNGLNAGDANLDALAATSREMIGLARGDARGYSMLGAVEEKAGNAAGAEQHYAAALEHSKSELHALLRLASIRLSQGNSAAALDNIDLLLRRWPDYWEQAKPILVAAAASAEDQQILTDKLNTLPPWRGRAVGAVAATLATLSYARDLITAAPASVRASPAWVGDRDVVINALVTAKAYSDAYALFLGTLTEKESVAAGYLFDGRFDFLPRRSYFGWRTQKPGAVDIAAGTGAGGIRVRFLDSPARPGIVAQNVMLPLGRYRLSMETATSGLRVSKGLFWRVACGEGQTLASLDVPTGSREKSRQQVDFEVPAAGCTRQTVTLDTNVKTDSWRDRYEGEARFDSLGITRL